MNLIQVKEKQIIRYFDNCFVKEELIYDMGWNNEDELLCFIQADRKEEFVNSLVDAFGIKATKNKYKMYEHNYYICVDITKVLVSLLNREHLKQLIDAESFVYA